MFVGPVDKCIADELRRAEIAMALAEWQKGEK
jgi:hypothetical protein